ncbi:IS200/IS605 family transposase, partial [bacterium]|nr:IS200/IS605 family transposase [bacterium]
MQVLFSLVLKYRYKVLDTGVLRTVDESLDSLCSWKKFEILEKNIQPDHVHIVLSFPPKLSVSWVVGYLKGKSAIKVFNRHEKMKRRYWGRHFWAQGYCVSPSSPQIASEWFKPVKSH